MARTLGIPSRVAVGFTSGTKGPDGRYHVTSHDAHAWPEIYLPGLRWTHLFDPTPSNQNTLTGGSNLPHDSGAGSTTVTTFPPQTTTPTTPSQSTPSGTGQGSAPPTAP